MPYEIFISYSRQAPGTCHNVLRILEDRLGYAGAVFVDTQGIPLGPNGRLRSTTPSARSSTYCCWRPPRP